tara:strand:+ start:467 stop:901 length:435 start_codon:yes stop_codon:yes gene_type:complete
MSAGTNRDVPQRKMESKTTDKNAEKPKLLSRGNPQVPKSEGDALLQAYIAAMPGWKQDIGRSIDDIVVSAVPEIRKAGKWHTPFSGVKGNDRFLGFHCLPSTSSYLFYGNSLDPVPPVKSKQKDVCYFHIYEGEEIEKPSLPTG